MVFQQIECSCKYRSSIPKYGALAYWESFCSNDLAALSPAMAAAYIIHNKNVI